MINILLSNRLGELRLTQAYLAKKTGIRPSTIGDLFNETADRINLKHLDLICDVLGCDICDVLTRNTNRVTQAEKVGRQYAAGTLASTEADFVRLFDAEVRKQKQIAQHQRLSQ